MESAIDQPGVYTIRNRDTGQYEYYVSFVPHDFVFQRGLPSEAIMGRLIDGPDLFEPEHFRTNARFLEFLHDVIARHAANCPGLIAEAQRQKEGLVYIIDARTQTPKEEVPPRRRRGPEWECVGLPRQPELSGLHGQRAADTRSLVSKQAVGRDCRDYGETHLTPHSSGPASAAAAVPVR